MKERQEAEQRIWRMRACHVEQQASARDGTYQTYYRWRKEMRSKAWNGLNSGGGEEKKMSKFLNIKSKEKGL